MSVVPFRSKCAPCNDPAAGGAPAVEEKSGGISAGVILLVGAGILAVMLVRRQQAEAAEQEKLRGLEDQLAAAERMERKEAAIRASLYDRAWV